MRNNFRMNGRSITLTWLPSSSTKETRTKRLDTLRELWIWRLKPGQTAVLVYIVGLHGLILCSKVVSVFPRSGYNVRCSICVTKSAANTTCWHYNVISILESCYISRNCTRKLSMTQHGPNIWVFYISADSLRSSIQNTLSLSKEVNWPTENKIRAKYYLGQTLLNLDSGSKEAMILDSQAKAPLKELLRHSKWDGIERYEAIQNYEVLFDYIVPWECRLATPRES